MTHPAKLFLLTGAVLLVIGMLWGIQMSATADHRLAPAHAHLNLVGFVLMSVFGGYYALCPTAAAGKLAVAHFWLHLLAVVVLIPGIVMAVTEAGESAAKIGSVLAVLSGLVFVYQVLRNPAPGLKPTA